jgi:tetratricopeptide (TPR) repeat protein
MPLLPVPDFLHAWLGSSPQASMVFTAVVLVCVLVVGLGLWLIIGAGPRRRRVFRRARQLLQGGSWEPALAIIRELQGRRPRGKWQDRLRRAEAECHRAAGKAFLAQKEYEQALEHLLYAAQLLGSGAAEARAGIVEAMLAEARALFAAGSGKDTGPVHALLARVLLVQSPCPEAAFWAALCRVRDGNPDPALTGLRAAGERPAGPAEQAAPAKRPVDPQLYLGALLLLRGEAKEALRWLTEANRMDSNCPFVIAQLGTAMIDAGGDALIAVRALQRALGPRGFLLWKAAPQRAWVEGMPEASYVRKLASQHPYVCPLWGKDLRPLLRQACTALAEGDYRLGNYQEAVDVFNRLLEEAAPSLAILRGLGLSLAQLGQYDQAFKHLRAAHELAGEDRTVAGHLAVCAARGKPLKPEDRANNIAWAVWLVGRFSAPGDAEWAGLVSAVFAEAREHGVPVAVADQAQLCEHLLSVLATDPAAAEAYHHLQGSDPGAVKPAYAWLYCRASQLHGLSGVYTLDLFARTFADAPAARAFFAEQGWDFDEVEYAFLARAAERQPGRFPEVLGPAYPARGEELLLGQVARLEAAGQADAALAAAEVFPKLAPDNPRALDRLAQLHYQRGDLGRAVELLEEWARLEPGNALPRVRQAVISRQRDDLPGCAAAVRQALDRTRGRARADVALLGARLTLGWLFATPDQQNPDGWRQALALLDECLRDDPGRPEALWCAAAVRSLLGDEAGLAAQAPAMNRPDVDDPRFHLLAGVCHLAAGNHPALGEACGRAAADPALAVEGAYLVGWDCIRRREPATAALTLQRVAQAPDSPSAGHAQAILGGIRFHQGTYDEAAQWWQRLDEARRKAWGFDGPLAGAVFLAALKDLREGRFGQAATRLREAGKLGRRDRRLEPLLALALFKAGQRLLYDKEARDPTHWQEAAGLLEQAVKVGCHDPSATYLLALCHKRRGETAEAQGALRKVAPADGNVFLQLGLLSFAEGQYAQAEEELARSRELDPSSYAAAYDLLLAQLALGKLPEAAALLPTAVALTADAAEKRFLVLLAALVHRTVPAGAAVPVARPSADAPPASNGDVPESGLAGMSRAEEQRLLELLCGLGQMETTYPLLRALADARPSSRAVQAAHLEAVLVQAKRLADRCHWTAAAQLLRPLARLIGEGAAPGPTAPRATQVALLNLLGVCDCMTQEFDQGARHFAAAFPLAGDDAWLHQNLALAHELHDRLDEAELHWNRYFDLIEAGVPAPALPGYREALAFEAVGRLGELYTKKEKWSAALPYVQRASRLRPHDADTLERLFHLYHQVRRPDDARRTLRKLRELRPADPQYELYELDVREVRTLDDIDRLLGDVARILAQHPNDMRVEERAVGLVGNVIPHIGRLCDQHSDRLARIVEQVRRLPSYQVNWPVVHDEMRRLHKEFQKLRRLSQKCLPLVTHAEHRRVIKELTDLIDSKIDVCHSLGG